MVGFTSIAQFMARVNYEWSMSEFKIVERRVVAQIRMTLENQRLAAEGDSLIAEFKRDELLVVPDNAALLRARINTSLQEIEFMVTENLARMQGIRDKLEQIGTKNPGPEAQQQLTEVIELNALMRSLFDAARRCFPTATLPTGGPALSSAR